MRNDFKEGAFLCHGKAWTNHKYVAKTKLSNGKWFYWYNLADYQRYLQRQGKSQGQNAKANPNKEVAEKAAKDSPAVKTLIEQGAKGNTTEEKTKNLKNDISNGESKINSLLSEESSKKSSSSSGSSKSSSSKSSGSSKSKSSKSSSSKEKSSSEKKSKESTGTSKSATSKVTTKQDAKLKAEERAFTSDSLKKLYGVKDEDVNKHESAEKMLDSMKSYKDGAFGYITAGDKTYKWTKENGNIVFKDFKTDKEVTLPNALNNIQEFRTDKKKKK